MSVSIKYYCSNCRESLKKQDKCCAKCGCKHRDIEMGIKDKIQLKGCLKIRYGPKGKRFGREILKGWRPSGDINKFPEGVDILREVDRKNKVYREIVRDRKTNKIVHENIEPLDQHR